MGAFKAGLKEMTSKIPAKPHARTTQARNQGDSAALKGGNLPGASAEHSNEPSHREMQRVSVKKTSAKNYSGS